MVNARGLDNSYFPQRSSGITLRHSRSSSRASIVSAHNTTLVPAPSHPVDKKDSSTFSQVVRNTIRQNSGKTMVKENIDASKPKRRFLDKINYELLKRGIKPKTRAFKEFRTHEQNEESAFIEKLREEFGAHAVIQAKNQLKQVTLYSQKARKALLKETRETYYKNLLKNYKGYIDARATLDVLLDGTRGIRQQFPLFDNDVIVEIQALKQIINDNISYGHHVDLLPDPSILGEIRKQVGAKSVALKKAIIDAVMQSPRCPADNILMPFETGGVMYDRIMHRKNNCAGLASLSHNYRAMVRQHIEIHKEVHDLAIQKQKDEIHHLILLIARTITKWAKLSSENNKFSCIAFFDFAVLMKLNAKTSAIEIEANANGLSYPIEVFLQKINQALLSINDPEFTRIFVENVKLETNCLLTEVNEQSLLLKETHFAKNNYVKTVHHVQHNIDFVVKKGVLINVMHDFLSPYNARVEDGEKRYSFFKEPRGYFRQLRNILFRARRDAYMITTVSNYIEKLAYANTHDEYQRVVDEVGKNKKLKKLQAVIAGMPSRDSKIK